MDLITNASILKKKIRLIHDLGGLCLFKGLTYYPFLICQKLQAQVSLGINTLTHY